MRLVHSMTFVAALLALAAVPACLQMARWSGLHPSSALATMGAACFVALLAGKRP